MTPIDAQVAMLSTIRSEIFSRLSECETHPAATAEHFSSISAIRQRANDCLQSARQAIAEFKSGIDRSVNTYKQMIEKSTLDLAEANRKSMEASAALSELEGRRMRSEWSSDDDAQLQRVASEARLQNSLSVSYEDYIRSYRGELVRIESTFESALPGQVSGLVDREEWLRDTKIQAETLWKELETRRRLADALKSDFESKSQSFKDAEGFHRDEARRLMWIIGLAAVTSGIAIGCAFFLRLDTSQIPSGIGLERLVLILGGRVALLLLVAWTIQFLGRLHRTHSEQAVIYQDRRAALGIIQSMINTTSDTKQRRELIRLLAEGYLNFEQSAFRLRGSLPNEKEGTVEREIRHVKRAIEAIQPLFETMGKVAEKAVEKVK
jgi:hypothetical protein